MRYFLLGASAGAMLFLIALFNNAFAAGNAAPVNAPTPTFSVALTRNDLSSLREICTLAMRNEKLVLEQATSVGSYCQDFLTRIGMALSAPSASAPPEAPKEPTP